MNNASKKLCLILASAALVFAGCSKKPTRPSPTDTNIMGPKTGPGSEGLNPSDLATTPPDLTNRGTEGGPGSKIAELEAVYFNFNESTIKASERPKLQKAKEYVDKNPGTRLVLEGHADWRGTPEYNLGLGDRRANAVKKFLGTIGVSADKIETLSKGSLEASKNADEATAAKDRRVEFLTGAPK